MRSPIPLASVPSILLTAFALAFPLSAAAEGPALQSGEGRYIVVLEDSVDHPGNVAHTQARRRDGRVTSVYHRVLKGYAATLPRDEVAALRQEPNVRYVTPDTKVEVESQGTPTGIERIGDVANEAVSIDEGDDLRVDADVAVIDTGIDYEHPDLDVITRTNCVPSSSNPEAAECLNGIGTDGHGHGTHVAGTIGALDNGEGVVGVAPGVRLWGVKVLNDGGTGYDSWIIAGIDWVTEHASQIEVANMSLGGPGKNPAMKEAIEASAEAGVVYVIAAGNENSDVKDHHPAGNPDAITVSAVADYDGKAGGEAQPLKTTCTEVDTSGKNNYGSDDARATFSNYGEGVDVAAPGVCIYSTWKNGSYKTISGTSMATPHVAGAAAILASQDNPEDLPDVEAIRETIEEEGNQGWQDTSGDGLHEPLLDVSAETVFAPTDQIAITGDAQVESTTEVTLHGSVNPGGKETKYYFEYGSTAQYGSKAPALAKEVSGAEYVNVQQTIEVDGHTLYHYRLVATTGGKTYYGADHLCATTPPAAQTGNAVDVHSNDATLTAAINPEGIDVSYEFEYGPDTSYGKKRPLGTAIIPAGTESIPVSTIVADLTGDKAYHYRVVATSVAGTTYGEDVTFTTSASEWKVKPTSAPGKSPWFAAVSCVSKNYCMALGNTSPEDGDIYSANWDGEEWSTLSMPVPAGVSTSTARDISCSSVNWCVATVWYVQGKFIIPYIERWNGESWSISSAPLPTHTEQAWLWTVSCDTAQDCMAVGYYKLEGSTTMMPLAIYWDGKAWALEETVSAGSHSRFESVSCVSPSYCMAAGYYIDAKSHTQFLSEVWDGEEWTIIQGPGAGEEELGELREVSCVSTENCTALVGYDTEVARWNGEYWARETLPEPVGAGSISLFDLSCTSADSCTAVGFWRPEAYGGLDYGRPVAVARNSSGWFLQSTVDPSQEEEPVGSLAWLQGVSCSLPNTCVSVGKRSDGNGSNLTLAEHREFSIPGAVTTPASSITTTSVVVNGTVNPEGLSTEYHFEWARKAEFEEAGYTHSTADETAGSGIAAVEVSESLSSLLSGTTYHYRLVAENDAGTAYGEDETFKTEANPTWTVSGKAFTGSETDTWKANGIKFQSPGGETIKCTSGLGNGTISGGSTAAVTAEFAFCKLQVAGCLAKGFRPQLSSELITADGIIYEKYTIQEGKEDTWAGNACFAGGKVSGSFAARIGPSAVESPRSFTTQAEEAVATALTIGGNKWQVRGTAKATLSGAKKGSELGAMNDPPKPPNESPIWHVEGQTFEEAGIAEKTFAMTADEGTTFNIVMEGSKIEIKCQEVSLSGTLANPDEGEATLNAGKCTINNSYCEVKPIEAAFDVGLRGDEDGTMIETFTPSYEGRIYFDIVKKSGLCSLSEKQYVTANKGSSLGLEMDFASEAEQHILGGSRSLALEGYGIDAADVWIDGLLTQQLNSGELFGAW